MEQNKFSDNPGFCVEMVFQDQRGRVRLLG